MRWTRIAAVIIALGVQTGAGCCRTPGAVLGENAWPAAGEPGCFRGDDTDGDGQTDRWLEVAHDVNRANAITQTQTLASGQSQPASQTFVHDRAGNLVFDGTLFYQYDGLNRLIRVYYDWQMQASTFDANGKPKPTWQGLWPGRVVLDLAYDGLGRLAWVRRYPPMSGVREDYYYDGVRRIQEGSFVAEVTDETRDYVWGPGYVDEVLAQVSRTGTQFRKVFTYLQDAAYNVVAILGGSFQTQRQYVFEPYGEVIFSETAGGDPNLLPVNRIGHQGLFFERFLLDPNDTFATPALDPNAVGVYVTRNRPYAPRLARWLSRDMNESAQPVVTALAMNGQSLGIVFGAFSALGHYGDGLSLYAYAGSNPVCFADPLGARRLSLSGATLLGTAFELGFLTGTVAIDKYFHFPNYSHPVIRQYADYLAGGSLTAGFAWLGAGTGGINIKTVVIATPLVFAFGVEIGMIDALLWSLDSDAW